MKENGLMSTQENTIRIPSTSQKKIELRRNELLQLQEENGAVAFTNLCVKVGLAVRVVPVVVNSKMSHPLEEERRAQEKIPILRQLEFFFYFRAVQGHIDILLQDLVVLSDDCTEYISLTWEASLP